MRPLLQRGVYFSIFRRASGSAVLGHPYPLQRRKIGPKFFISKHKVRSGLCSRRKKRPLNPSSPDRLPSPSLDSPSIGGRCPIQHSEVRARILLLEQRREAVRR